MSLLDALLGARRTLDDAGYRLARLEIFLDPGEVRYAQREELVAQAIVDEALHPRMPARSGARPLARVLVDGGRDVFLYVTEGGPHAPPHGDRANPG